MHPASAAVVNRSQFLLLVFPRIPFVSSDHVGRSWMALNAYLKGVFFLWEYIWLV